MKSIDRVLTFRAFGCNGRPTAQSHDVFSSAALRTAPGNLVYAASKGGIVSAVKGLEVELVLDGVRFNVVAAAINFLLADTAHWITGSVLCVDGGFLA